MTLVNYEINRRPFASLIFYKIFTKEVLLLLVARIFEAKRRSDFYTRQVKTSQMPGFLSYQQCIAYANSVKARIHLDHTSVHAHFDAQNVLFSLIESFITQFYFCSLRDSSRGTQHIKIEIEFNLHFNLHFNLCFITL